MRMEHSVSGMNVAMVAVIAVQYPEPGLGLGSFGH